MDFTDLSVTFSSICRKRFFLAAFPSQKNVLKIGEIKPSAVAPESSRAIRTESGSGCFGSLRFSPFENNVYAPLYKAETIPSVFRLHFLRACVRVCECSTPLTSFLSPLSLSLLNFFFRRSAVSSRHTPDGQRPVRGREAQRGDPEGPSGQRGPPGGGGRPEDHQRGSRHPPPGEVHAGSGGSHHR